MSSARALEIAHHIVRFEGRFDSKGLLKVYDLPAGDGGGDYEVAGINSRYHPKEAYELRLMIENGEQRDAARKAAEYIAKYTDLVAQWTRNPAVEAYLRDCAFNRGPTGAAKIAQMAFGALPDGRVGQKTLAAIEAKEFHPGALEALREARERYERHFVGRNEKSKFWRGLVNRWDKALEMAELFDPS